MDQFGGLESKSPVGRISRIVDLNPALLPNDREEAIASSHPSIINPRVSIRVG